MNRKSARAILVCKERIEKALAVCLSQLDSQELEYAEAYWAAHCKACFHGGTYGAAPIATAISVMDTPSPYQVRTAIKALHGRASSEALARELGL